VNITFADLYDLIARSKSLPSDFWKEDPLYIELGSYSSRRSVNTIPLAVAGGPDVIVDVNEAGEALGIEFLGRPR